MEMTFNASSSTWYRGNDFEDAHLVTDAGSNQTLGINAIRFTAPKDVQVAAGVLANVSVRMSRLWFSGTLWKGKDGQQFIRFTPEQRKTKQMVDGVEVTRNIDLINLDSCIVAQILRYAEKHVNYAATVSPEQAQYNAQLAQQQQAQRQAQIDAQIQAQMAQQQLAQQQQFVQQQQVVQQPQFAPQQSAVDPSMGMTPQVTPGMQSLSPDAFAGVAGGNIGDTTPPF